MNTQFKSCIKPDYASEDSEEPVSKILASTKEELLQKLPDPELFKQITEIFEKSYKEIVEISLIKAAEKFSIQKTVNVYIEKSVKHTEKKIAAFQKEARKLSAERRGDYRDITPVRSSINRSMSPAEKKTISTQQENADLKELLKKVQMERDILKAWKENVLKLPGNFSEDSASVIKELESYRKQLATSNKVLTSKLSGIIMTVQKFLKDTYTFQKTTREKEGFNSVNFYENEKHKLELKLKEMSEFKENAMFSPAESPFRKPNGSVDWTHFTEKVSSFESENKILKNQLRDYKKSVKTLEIKCAELENFRWKAEKEKQLLERRNRYSVFTPTSARKCANFLKVIEGVKTWAEGRFNEILTDFELKLNAVQLRLLEKENLITEVRNRFTENLKENLNVLIAMNENLKNSNLEKSNDDALNVQIENLEYIIEQNRIYSEIKVQELTETIELLETQRNSFMKSNQHLEKENVSLKHEINKIKELESHLKNSKLMIVELEENNKIFSNKIRQLKQKELELDQVSYEKAIMKGEINKLTEEISQKDKFIIELQQTLKIEERQANSFLEDLAFKEKAAKSELEMMKVELDNCRAELIYIEDISQQREQRIKLLESQLCSLKAIETH